MITVFKSVDVVYTFTGGFLLTIYVVEDDETLLKSWNVFVESWSKIILGAINTVHILCHFWYIPRTNLNPLTPSFNRDINAEELFEKMYFFKQFTKIRQCATDKFSISKINKPSNLTSPSNIFSFWKKVTLLTVFFLYGLLSKFI